MVKIWRNWNPRTFLVCIRWCSHFRKQSSSPQELLHSHHCAWACMLGRVQLVATPWTVAQQAHLSMKFSRQGYWRGCYFLFQEIFSPRDRTRISCISCIGRQILYHCTTWEALHDLPIVVVQFSLSSHPPYISIRYLYQICNHFPCVELWLNLSEGLDRIQSAWGIKLFRFYL